MGELTFASPRPAERVLSSQYCDEHKSVVLSLAELKKDLEKQEGLVRGLEISFAKMQGRWAVIAVFGMAAVSALFKYVLP